MSEPRLSTPETQILMAMPLRADVKLPLQPESDEDTLAEKAESKVRRQRS